MRGDNTSLEPSAIEPPVRAPGLGLVHSLFEIQAARSSDRIAVTDDHRSMSFGELNEQANRLAHCLLSIGIGSGSTVCIYLDRSPHMLVGLFGVLKAGATYVPLDSIFPPERLSYMISDSGAGAVLTLGRLTGELPKHQARMIELDDAALGLESFSTENPQRNISPADLAYVIYTSGSTGKPKGVEVTHGGVANFLSSINRILQIDLNEVFMAVTTLSFDICAFDLFSPLAAGGKILLVDRETAMDGVRLRNRLEKSDVTVLQATPATWRMLISAGWPGPLADRTLKALSGGEALPRELADAIMSRRVDLWNLYGPTETTIYSTYHQVVQSTGKVPIGRALDNTTLYILDAEQQPVQPGEAGELCIGGAGVARGYRNRAQLTAEKFLADPFADVPEEKMYRTGDIARFRSDGILEYLGRADHQVKLRGFRIELEEIESVLLRQASVNAAVVVAQERENGSKRLVGFVSPKAGHAASPGELREELKRALPEYMVPAVISPLHEFPLTPNGKIDRKALPLPEWGETAEAEYIEPSDEIQRELAGVFASVLDVPRVGAGDNFFELGGDSLSAVNLAIHVKRRFKRELTIASLYESPTVAQLSAAMFQKSPNESLMLLRPGSSKPPLFCLPGSGGSSLCFTNLLEHFADDRPIYGYNIPQSLSRRAQLRTVQDYAKDALAEIKRVCPDGRFHLLGYSFGGNIAFEIAHLLEDQSYRLGFLGVIDSWVPGYPSKLTLFPRISHHIGNLLRGEPEPRLKYFTARCSNVTSRFTRRGRRMLRFARTLLNIQPTAEQTLAYILEDAEGSLLDYHPKVIDRQIDFFRIDFPPTDWPGCNFDDLHNGFAPLVNGPINITRLPCNHRDVFEPAGVLPMARSVKIQMELQDSAQLAALSG